MLEAKVGVGCALLACFLASTAASAQTVEPAAGGHRPGVGKPRPPTGASGGPTDRVPEGRPAAPLHYEPPPPEPCFTGIGAYLDQDWLLIVDRYNMDRNYTMGLAFQASGAWVKHLHLSDPLDALDALTGVNRLRQATQALARDEILRKERWAESHSLMLGNGAFTPDNLNTAMPLHDDRPYASLLYLAVGHSTIFPGNAQRRAHVWRSEISVGVLGLHVADWAQTKIHAAMREASGGQTPYAPLGWSNQISEGGEPTFKYMVAHLRELSASSFHDLSLTFDLNAGYYTNTAAGALMRLGRIRSNAWSLNTNPIGSANQAEAASGCCAPIRARNTFEVYAYAAGRMRLVAYNALLQGQFRHSEVRLSAGEIERLVGEFETGVVLGGAGVSVTFMVIGGRTPEYQLPNVAPRTHTWGGVYLTWLLPSG